MRILLSAVLFLYGCAASPRPGPSWRKATVDPGGNVVAFWARRAQGDDPAVLKKDFGMLVVWDEKDRRFFIFDNVRKRCFGTLDFDAFIGELERLPRGTPLGWIDTCCASLCWRMPGEARDRVDRIFEAHPRARGADPDTSSLICICESGGLRFPRID